MDLMCSDYRRAAENRDRIRLKRNIEGYLWVEAVVKGWPRRKPLPEWIPQGELPVVGAHEARQLQRYGMHEIDEVNDD